MTSDKVSSIKHLPLSAWFVLFLALLCEENRSKKKVSPGKKLLRVCVCVLISSPYCLPADRKRRNEFNPTSQWLALPLNEWRSAASWWWITTREARSYGSPSQHLWSTQSPPFSPESLRGFDSRMGKPVLSIATMTENPQLLIGLLLLHCIEQIEDGNCLAREIMYSRKEILLTSRNVA